MRQKSRHNWNFKVQLQDRGAQSSDLTKWRWRGKVASLLSGINDHDNLQLAVRNQKYKYRAKMQPRHTETDTNAEIQIYRDNQSRIDDQS